MQCCGATRTYLVHAMPAPLCAAAGLLLLLLIMLMQQLPSPPAQTERAASAAYQYDFAEVECAGPEGVLDMFTSMGHKQLKRHLRSTGC